MSKMDTAWAIVLAAGEGSRLSALTRAPNGQSIPKQFCSLDGGPTLLESTVKRAASVVGKDHVVAVVAAHHRKFWEPQLRGIPRRSVVVQPRNRGTAAGILLPLLHVLQRDPGARITVFPSDHYVGSESTLRVSLFESLEGLSEKGSELILLGISPDNAAADYGWILPRCGPGRMHAIRRFVEKPRQSEATRFHASGGLWNSFLFTARGQALLDLYGARLPQLLAAFGVRPGSSLSDLHDLEDIYGRLGASDFSRDVLEGSEANLRVLQVPPCGWTDLGTPGRVAECLLKRRPLQMPARSNALELRAQLHRVHPEMEFDDGRAVRPSASPKHEHAIPSTPGKGVRCDSNSPPPCIWYG